MQRAMPDLKRCSKCGEWKPATREFFEPRHDRGMRLRGVCRICRETLNHARYERYRRSHSDAVRARSRAWKEKNPDRCREHDRTRYAKHTAKRLAATKKWRVENRDRARELSVTWRKNNPEKAADSARKRSKRWRIHHPDAARAYHQMYVKQHADAYAAAARRRRAKKVAASGNHTAADIRRIYHEQQGLCFYCKIELTGRFHVDHMVPLDRGGSDWPDNLCCACQSCNLRKHTKTAEEFLAGMEGTTS